MGKIVTVFNHDGSTVEMDLSDAKTWKRDLSHPYPLNPENPDGWANIQGHRYYFDAVIRVGGQWIMHGRDSTDESGTRTAYNELYLSQAATLLRMMGKPVPPELKGLSGGCSPSTRETIALNAVRRALVWLIQVSTTYLRNSKISDYLGPEEDEQPRTSLDMLKGGIDQLREKANVNLLPNLRAFWKLERLVEKFDAKDQWVPDKDDIRALRAVLKLLGDPVVEVPVQPMRPEKRDYLMSLSKYGQKSVASSNCETISIEDKPMSVPTFDQLREVYDSLTKFLNKNQSSWNCVWMNEDDFLLLLVRLGDALRPFREFTDAVPGWPDKVRRALAAIVKGFDTTTRDWGWEQLAEPGPTRLTYERDRRKWFADEVTKPVFLAAISWQEGYEGLDFPSDVDQWADEGRKLGYMATMSRAEGQASFRPAHDRWRSTSRFGPRVPKIKDELYNLLCQASNILDGALKEMQRETAANRNAYPMPSHDASTAETGAAKLNDDSVAQSNIQITLPETPAVGMTIENATIKLRKKRATVQATLLEYMKGRQSATLEDIARNVHGDSETSDDAIRQNVGRLNDSLVEFKIPIKFLIGGGLLHKEILPE